MHCNNGSVLSARRIWLATGTLLDATIDPLLSDIFAAYPPEIVNGLPILDKHLRVPGCEVFLMGGYSALQVGPLASNLGGGRIACDRIIPAIVKPSLAFRQ